MKAQQKNGTWDCSCELRVPLRTAPAVLVLQTAVLETRCASWNVLRMDGLLLSSSPA